MILLIGGTSETPEIARELLAAGFAVIVSTATDVALEIEEHPNLLRRRGALDQAGMVKLAREAGVRLIVDASHPYATAVRDTARRTAQELVLPYLTWVRPPVVDRHELVHFARDHEDAARIACAFGRPVLLTTGSRNLAPYVAESRRRGVALIARVLDHPTSREACRSAGIPEDCILTGRGPFPVEENRALIRRFSVGVVVTKDSGAAGGVPEKLEAARLEGCHVVVIQRPNVAAGTTFSNLSGLLVAVTGRMAQHSP